MIENLSMLFFLFCVSGFFDLRVKQQWGNSIDKNLKNFLIKQQLYRKIQNFVTLKWETKP